MSNNWASEVIVPNRHTRSHVFARSIGSPITSSRKYGVWSFRVQTSTSHLSPRCVGSLIMRSSTCAAEVFVARRHTWLHSFSRCIESPMKRSKKSTPGDLMPISHTQSHLTSDLSLPVRR